MPFPGELTSEEKLRYSRTLLLDEAGEQGQRKLKAAAVLLVGAGGLGSSVAICLAAAGVGRIGIADPDVVDISNLQRQIIHRTESVGRLKVTSAREQMLRLNPHVRVETHADSFHFGNAEKISSDYEIIVDGTDNFHTRRLINEVCVRLGKPYVYGAIYRFEGQVSVFDARRGPCYACLFGETPPPHDNETFAAAPNGIFSVLPNTVGTIQASEVVKLILGIGAPLLGRLLLYDALQMSFQEVQISKAPGCPVCACAGMTNVTKPGEKCLTRKDI